MQNFWETNKLLILILILAAVLRFHGLNWDQNQHLHPDERFLTMVSLDMKIPSSFSDYLDPQISTFNPVNTDHKYFVYGIFPLTLNKLIAVLLDNNSYNSLTLQGRFISALFDLAVVFWVYLTIFLLQKRFQLDAHLKYWGAFFYAIMVLPIQLAHFFAVDTFLNFFIITSCYFFLRFALNYRFINLVIGSISFGLAISCKVNALLFTPLFVLFISIKYLNNWGIGSLKNFSKSIIPSLLIFCLAIFITVRLIEPYYFQTANIFDFQINNAFKLSLNQLTDLYKDKDVWFPPAVSLMHRTILISAFKDVFFYGSGLVISLFVFLGFYQIISLFKKQSLLGLILGAIAIWIIIIFTFQSSRFLQVIRYYIYLFPFLAIFASFGVGFLLKPLKTWAFFQKFTFFFIIISSLIWPLMFFSIYINEHPRITASKWIYQNIPSGSVVLGEYWDDPLPLMLNNPSYIGKTYTIKMLPVFDQDNDTKWQQMKTLLDLGNYYVLSSNRGWGSITLAPWKYPQTSVFYQDLLDGKLGYQKIAEFTSYPSLKYLGIPLEIDDEDADEAFSVYDHPKVMILKKTI